MTSQATFCFGDSHLNPTARGTSKVFLPVLAKLLETCFVNDTALGVFPLRPKALLTCLQEPYQDLNARILKSPRRNLDHYIEAQIHSEISLATDIEALVADDSFRNTPIETAITRLCQHFDIALYWRPGFSLAIDAVPDDFRGPQMPLLAQKIAIQEKVSAYAIGVEAHRIATGLKDEEALQALKLLWHLLVKYG